MGIKLHGGILHVDIARRCDSSAADRYDRTPVELVIPVSAQHHHSNSSSSSSSRVRLAARRTMTDMAETDGDFHDYINFEYYLQNIGKYRNWLR